MTDYTLLYNANIIVSYNDTNRYNYILFNHTTALIIEVGYDYSKLLGDPSIQHKHDCEQHTIIPGLIDSHIHVEYVGKHIVSLDLNLSTSIGMLQLRLKQYVDQQPNHDKSQWIVGFGWEQDRLGRYPTRYDIDQICSDQPIILWRICHHIAVCNTKALQLAGITSNTQHHGGIIDLDSSHELTGILRERSAEIVNELVVDNEEIRTSYILAGLNECLVNGLTCVQTNDSNAWNIYKKLYDQGKIPIRVYLTIMYDELNNSHELRPNANEYYYSDHTTNDYMLNSHRIKLFGDGALGSETAALSDNYVTVLHEKCNTVHTHSNGQHTPNSTDIQHNDNKGVLIHQQSELTQKVQRAHKLGYRIELHVIGDAATDSGLTAFEQAGLQAIDRPILTHCQVLRADLLPRMKQLGVIANIQPQFTVTDSRWISDRLPSHLLTYSYIWKTLMNDGIHVAGGSDAPIELCHPLLGIYSAIYRPYENYHAIQQVKQGKVIQRPDVDECGRWIAGQCLSPQQALQIYTSEGAYCAGLENKLGKLHTNYFADLTILSVDPILQSDQLLSDHIVQQVWVHGRRRL